MITNRSDGLETRGRLLDAAASVFAAKGFRDAKTAEICRLAGANVAAVNYYFGGKENLYKEAWGHAFERSIEVHPPDGGILPDAPAEQRLRGQIVALVHRVMDPQNLELDIVHKEMACPTGLLSEMMRRSIDPLREAFLDVVRELLGPCATEQDAQLCEMSIHAQCFFQLLRHRHGTRASADASPPAPPALDVGIDDLVDHIVRFSLAGLRECLRQSPLKSKHQKMKEPSL